MQYATPATVREDLNRIHIRRYGREPMTYTVGDAVPTSVVEGAWEMATDVTGPQVQGKVRQCMLT